MNTRIVLVLENLSVLRLSSQLASYASQRHAVIADNIANADTPDYKAKDLVDFHDVFKAAQDRGEAILPAFNPVEKGDPHAVSPNGNTVSLEEQMMKSAQTQNDHALALLMYRKSLSLVQMAVSKNL